MHICELTRIDRMSPAFKATEPQTKSSLLSLTLVLSHHLLQDCVGNIKHFLLNKLIYTLLISKFSESNYFLAPKPTLFLSLFF